LISTGEVDTSDCSASVLLTNGNAGTCGESVAYDTVWTGRTSMIPRFWMPVATTDCGKDPKGNSDAGITVLGGSENPYEYGFGSLSENGVDSLLMTDSASFLEVCVPT
jgi:hypothetical protein